MALFEPAFTRTMKWEDPGLTGIVTKDPSRLDPNAVARFGINSAFHPKAVSDGFYTMERDPALQYAANVYKAEYWVPIGGFQITDSDVACKFFDMAVNEGIVQATKIVQRAVNSLMAIGQLGLSVDGKSGQRTINGINQAMPSELLLAIKEKAKEFYMAVAAAQPEKRKDLDGWLARVNS